MNSSGLYLCKLRWVEFFDRLTMLLQSVELSRWGISRGKTKPILLVDQFEDMLAHSFEFNKKKNRLRFTPFGRKRPLQCGK